MVMRIDLLLRAVLMLPRKAEQRAAQPRDKLPIAKERPEGKKQGVRQEITTRKEMRYC